MEWLANTDTVSQSVATISNAFEVLRENPPQAKPQTKRLGSLARRSKGLTIEEDIGADDAEEVPHGVSGRFGRSQGRWGRS